MAFLCDIPIEYQFFFPSPFYDDYKIFKTRTTSLTLGERTFAYMRCRQIASTGGE